MANKNSTHDEKLIQELYEKLWWYTHEASEEEFNEKEVDAIVQLLDVLEPIKEDNVFEPGVDAAFGRFQERFGLEEEFGGDAGENDENEGKASGDAANADSGADSAAEQEKMVSDSDNDTVKEAAGKDIRRRRSRKKTDWKRIGIRVGIGVAACLVLLISLDVGTYALRKQSFIEVIRQGNGKTEIIVTGDVDEITPEVMEFDSWEELQEWGNYENLQPKYWPDTYQLKNLILENAEDQCVIRAVYEDNSEYIRMIIYVHAEIYKKNTIQFNQEWVLVEETEKVQIYLKDQEYIIYAVTDNWIYHIASNAPLEVIQQISKNF